MRNEGSLSLSISLKCARLKLQLCVGVTEFKSAEKMTPRQFPSLKNRVAHTHTHTHLCVIDLYKHKGTHMHHRYVNTEQQETHSKKIKTKNA